MPDQYPFIGVRLLEYCSMDMIFVAVNLEGVNAICGKLDFKSRYRSLKQRGIHNSQTGIAFLDTRDLNKAAESALSARQFCTGLKWYCETVPCSLVPRRRSL